MLGVLLESAEDLLRQMARDQTDGTPRWTCSRDLDVTHMFGDLDVSWRDRIPRRIKLVTGLHKGVQAVGTGQSIRERDQSTKLALAVAIRVIVEARIPIDQAVTA